MSAGPYQAGSPPGHVFVRVSAARSRRWPTRHSIPNSSSSSKNHSWIRRLDATRPDPPGSVELAYSFPSWESVRSINSPGRVHHAMTVLCVRSQPTISFWPSFVPSLLLYRSLLGVASRPRYVISHRPSHSQPRRARRRLQGQIRVMGRGGTILPSHTHPALV